MFFILNVIPELQYDKANHNVYLLFTSKEVSAYLNARYKSFTQDLVDEIRIFELIFLKI